MFYAGIGSRQTPPQVLKLMTAIATGLKNKGYVLRSGGAMGADTAFHKGAQAQAEIFLPWKGYNNVNADVANDTVTLAALELASHYHPAWGKCGKGARLLHARNMYIILGKDLDSPVKWVICWTPNGEVTGGTGQALRLAMDRGISVFNLGVPEMYERAKRKYLEPAQHELLLMTEGEGL